MRKAWRGHKRMIATMSFAGEDPPIPLPLHPRADALSAQFASFNVQLPTLYTVARRKGVDEFPAFQVASDDAVPIWKALRALTDHTGWYPMITRNQSNFLHKLDEREKRSTRRILKRAKSIDINNWLAKRRHWLQFDAEGRPVDCRSPGSTCTCSFYKSFVLPHDVSTREPVDDVYIILFPTKDPCEVPAYIGFGNWNSCAHAEYQVAMLRKWHREFGTEPVTFLDDMLECSVARRPATFDDALRLAAEQFLYCDDNLCQGHRNFDAYADYLMTSDIWYFWWD